MSETSEEKPTPSSIGSIEVRGMSLRRFIEWFGAINWSDQDMIRVDMKMTHRSNMSASGRNKFDTSRRKGAFYQGRKAWREAREKAGKSRSFTMQNPFEGTDMESHFVEGWNAERTGKCDLRKKETYL